MVTGLDLGARSVVAQVVDPEMPMLTLDDLGVIRYMCDRVAVMYRGKVVETGPARQVCDHPAHAYTQALLSAIPRPDPRARRMHQRFRYVA